MTCGFGRIDKLGQGICPSAASYIIGQQNGGIRAAALNGLQDFVTMLTGGKGGVDNAN
ncbi:hypothetical protein [Pseudanabaena sp. FACHB-2040]|uniref:hypothetical protein n=1 Tax=Pseudanabaena sp. FACHB-2040 TaxID=2692859 RepID=UPI001F5542E5|nr:hypothetical protein [Pseudanabaena sp. FACHB-2040]